jgi:predicted DNA binding CopG/RHH family protein
MRKEYDFSKGKRNPYTHMLKKQVTIRLDEKTVEYFKKMAKDAGIPYQTLINLYLRDCAASSRRLRFRWDSRPAQGSRTSFSTAR